MTFAAFAPHALSALGSVASGLLGGSGVPHETKMQKTQRKLIDQLISSLSGKGPLADLYRTDDESFNKSFVEPAQAMYRNKIAPQIQQQYINSGQQRNTNLDDTLTRAGIDLDTLLNQHLMEYQQGAQNRQQDAIRSILGAGSGAPAQPSFGQNLQSAIGGYLNSDAFTDLAKNVYKPTTNSPLPTIGNTTAPSNSPNDIPNRRGYLPNWELGNPNWSRR